MQVVLVYIHSPVILVQFTLEMHVAS